MDAGKFRACRGSHDYGIFLCSIIAGLTKFDRHLFEENGL